MGFFNRLSSKNASNPAGAGQEAKAQPLPSSGILPQLAAAREKLEMKDLQGALAIYEELLQTSGDRPDVLVTLSADLGSCGYVDQIVELIAPRYDADRHGPATGINLLQAYLATRNSTAAQHLLDILFALKKPELQERLYGFSNALAELIEAENQGLVPTTDDPNQPATAKKQMVNLASISKPIWAYGIEDLPGLLPRKEGRLRRVAFAQLALLNLPEWDKKMVAPEDDLGRFSRGFPLWLHETFYYCPHYSPIAAVGMFGKDHYAIFGSEWSTENIRQLAETTSEGIDYVFTGSLRHQNGDYELTVRVWEVKKFRERKAFTARWTPATADAELAKLQEQIRLFMEWAPYPAGAALNYKPVENPFSWCQTLGASVSLFLIEKQVLPASQLALPAEFLPQISAGAAASELNSLAWLTTRHRAQLLGLTDFAAVSPALVQSPLVEQAEEKLGR
jgi:hypothetical protein